MIKDDFLDKSIEETQCRSMLEEQIEEILNKPRAENRVAYHLSKIKNNNEKKEFINNSVKNYFPDIDD